MLTSYVNSFDSHNNGNPLQCSCLENPRDGGAGWAAGYGVAESRARLKQLSSSSSNCLNVGRLFHVKDGPLISIKVLICIKKS